MIQKFKESTSLRYFFLYSYIYACFGFIIIVIGPVIPFLSSKHQIPEAEFAILFTCRSVGFTVGALLARQYSDSFNTHTVLTVSTILAGIPFIPFPFTDSINLQGFYIFFSSIFCSVIDITLPVTIVQSHKGTDESYWLQLCHAIFGLGGLVAPILISYLGQYGCVWVGIAMALSALASAKLDSPELLNKQKALDSQNKEVEYQPISRISVLLLALMFVTFFSAEMGFTGWISSYTVMEGLESKEGAAKYPSIFWIFITVFCFFSAGLPGKVSYKLILLNKLEIAACAASIILTMIGFKLFAVYWNSILLGIAFSAMYTFMFTISLEYKQSISRSQNALIMMFANFGEGILCSIVGHLMTFFSPIALYYSILLAGILILGFTYILMKDLAKNEPKEEIELKDKLISE